MIVENGEQEREGEFQIRAIDYFKCLIVCSIISVIFPIAVTSPLHLNATLSNSPLQTDSFIPVGKAVLFTVTPKQVHTP